MLKETEPEEILSLFLLLVAIQFRGWDLAPSPFLATPMHWAHLLTNGIVTI